MRTETAIEFINVTHGVGQFFVHEMDYRLKDIDLSYQQAVVLLHLLCTKGCSPSDLGAALRYQTQSITTIVNRMVDKGSVEKQPGKYKASSKFLCLTEAGEVKAKEAFIVIEKAIFDLGIGDNIGLDLGNIRELWQVGELASFRRPTGVGKRQEPVRGAFVIAWRDYLRREGKL